MMKARRTILCLAMILLLMCAGCQKEPELVVLEEGQYYTYYVNSSGTALVSRIYEPQASDVMGIIEELFAQCQMAPDSGEGRRAIPSNVVVAEAPRLEERIVNLYFDNTYTTMDQVTELLCKAAMAKTITQLEDVDYIRIHINGEVYRGSNTYNPTPDGEPAGPPAILAPEKTLWSGADFLDNTGDDTNKYMQEELVLYFGNVEGKALVAEVREVVYSSTLSMERVVMNQLLEGPKEDGMTATLPKDVKVQGVSVRDGVCYVDFDATFLDEPVNVTDQVVIYSVVNSLTELPNVHQVQFTVNGSTDVMLRNNISLASRFEKDLTMLAMPEESMEETQETILPTETEPTLSQESQPDESEREETTAEETSIEDTAEETMEDTVEDTAEETTAEGTTVETATGI